MRKILVVIAIVVLLGAAYLGSIALSVRGLIDAARSGNVTEVAARSDFVRLRRSISEQILDAYLDKNGRNRKPLERMLIDTYGTSVADAMLSKFLTPANLTSLLYTGTVADVSQAAVWQLPSLATIDPARLWDFVSRVRPVQIKQVELRISASDAPELYAAVGLRLDGATWRISGLRLPKTVVEKLASSLPSR